MKLFLSLLGILTLLFACSAYVQAQSSGSVCIAPPARPTAGEKSLANSAGGNTITTYAIQIDRKPSVIASNDEAVKISGVSLGRKHLVKIIGDGRVVQSFWFKFSSYKSRELCLWFNELYETWSLWEAKDAGAKCRCH